MIETELSVNDEVSEGEREALQKRVLTFLLKAGLFWNNNAIVQAWVEEDGIYYHHNSISAGEEFFEFLRSIGVLVPAGRKSHRLAIRQDAVAGFADFTIERGIDIALVIEALVCLGGYAGWLPTTRGSFDAKFYENSDGTTSFDTRSLMSDLLSLEYAERASGRYRWSSAMEPALKANHL